MKKNPQFSCTKLNIWGPCYANLSFTVFFIKLQRCKKTKMITYYKKDKNFFNSKFCKDCRLLYQNYSGQSTCLLRNFPHLSWASGHGCVLLLFLDAVTRRSLGAICNDYKVTQRTIYPFTNCSAGCSEELVFRPMAFFYPLSGKRLALEEGYCAPGRWRWCVLSFSPREWRMLARPSFENICYTRFKGKMVRK